MEGDREVIRSPSYQRDDDTPKGSIVRKPWVGSACWEESGTTGKQWGGKESTLYLEYWPENSAEDDTRVG